MTALDPQLQAPVATQLLLERLFWAVPMARWQAALAIRDLLEDVSSRDPMRVALLDCLRTRDLESEVCALLNVVLITRADARPNCRAVVQAISKPSQLAQLLLDRAYSSAPLMPWRAAHAGPAPLDFEALPYFEENWTAHVPPILSNSLRKLQLQTGLPLLQQWAYEWQHLTTALDAPYSGYCYYFDRPLSPASGVIGQYFQRQTEIYRSAYHRTFALAVDRWSMPASLAGSYVLDSAYGLCGLVDVQPSTAPDWVASFVAQCASEPNALDANIKQTLLDRRPDDWTIIGLRAPTPFPHEFGSVSTKTFLVTDDFEAGAPLERPGLFFDRSSTMSLSGSFDGSPGDGFTQAGEHGHAESAGALSWFYPMGLWQNDYHHNGLMFPSPNLVREDAAIESSAVGIDLQVDGTVVSKSWFWLDHWSPHYVREGSTRCGSICVIRSDIIREAAASKGLKLGWRAELNLPKRERDYDKYQVDQFFAFVTE